jgi:glycosyltransferase involved in cell wall biosynthesis
MNETILVRGWRGISHSFSMVNQYQMLELMKLGYRLFHEDLPMMREEWIGRASSSGFSAVDQAIIDSLSSLDSSERPDFTYRIAWPLYLKCSNARLHNFVFHVNEYQSLINKVHEENFYDSKSNPMLTVVTPSKWSEQGLLKAGFPQDRILVNQHGVDSTVYHPATRDTKRQIRQTLGISDNQYVYFSAGTMTLNKGIDILIPAFFEVWKRNRNSILILKDASSLHYSNAHSILKEIFNSRTDLQSAEFFKSIRCISDALSLNQMRELYQLADCYVSPYRAEGFGLTPLEAASCGCPIIVTAGGATDEYAHESFALKIEGVLTELDGRTYIEPSLDHLIELMWLVQSKDVKSLSPERARKQISSHHSWAVSMSKLSAVMKLYLR